MNLTGSFTLNWLYLLTPSILGIVILPIYNLNFLFILNSFCYSQSKSVFDLELCCGLSYTSLGDFFWFLAIFWFDTLFDSCAELSIVFILCESSYLSIDWKLTKGTCFYYCTDIFYGKIPAEELLFLIDDFGLNSIELSLDFKLVLFALSSWPK